jgi:para-nitrobenzyl esterase
MKCCRTTRLTDAEVPRSSARLATDFKIVTPTTQVVRGVARAAPVYFYRFSRVSLTNRASFGGAAHTTEMPYVFDQIEVQRGQTDERDKVLSQEMAGAWVQFVKTGKPDGGDLPRWPALAAPGYEIIDFADTTKVTSAANNPVVAFFEARPPSGER